MRGEVDDDKGGEVGDREHLLLWAYADTWSLTALRRRATTQTSTGGIIQSFLYFWPRDRYDARAAGRPD